MSYELLEDIDRLFRRTEYYSGISWRWCWWQDLVRQGISCVCIATSSWRQSLCQFSGSSPVFITLSALLTTLKIWCIVGCCSRPGCNSDNSALHHLASFPPPLQPSTPSVHLSSPPSTHHGGTQLRCGQGTTTLEQFNSADSK